MPEYACISLVLLALCFMHLATYVLYFKLCQHNQPGPIHKVFNVIKTTTYLIVLVAHVRFFSSYIATYMEDHTMVIVKQAPACKKQFGHKQ